MEVLCNRADRRVGALLLALSVLYAPSLIAADDVPDFSGVWIGGGRGGGPPGGGMAPGGMAPGGGGFGQRAQPQVTPQAQEIMDDYDLLVDDPVYECSPSSIFRAWANPTPSEIEQQGDRVILRNEFMDVVRTVFLDGRERPADEPARVLGHSTGRYEGETLVIETTGFASSTLHFITGIPQTETLRATERLTLSEDGQRITMEQTYEDPATFTAPWTSTRTLVRRPDLTLLEFGCVLEDAGYETE